MVVQFDVNVDGTVANIVVLRDEYGCEDEVIRVFELMNKMDLRYSATKRVRK